MGWLGKLLSKAAPALPLLGSAIDAFSQRSANRQNRQLAREQMAFQERMSSTEWQRAVADMQAAELNPMLAYNQGPASAPSGATAHMEPITRNTATTALAVKMQKEQIENIDQQNRLLQAQTWKTKMEAETEQARAENIAYGTTKLEYETESLAQTIKRQIIDLDLSSEQLRTARLTNSQLERIQPLLYEYQRLINQAEELGMTQRQVDQKFAEQLGDDAKYIHLIRMILGR